MRMIGIGLLAICFLIGKAIGTQLGASLGLSNDVGGVGFAMVLLMATTTFLKKRKLLSADFQSGIHFWASMYIPVVIAMAFSLNVTSAVSSGFLAILAGLSATLLAFVAVKWLTNTLSK